MKQSSEFAITVFPLALFAKPTNPLIRLIFANGNKCGRFPPLGTETTWVKVSKLCMTSLHNVKELIGLEQV